MTRSYLKAVVLTVTALLTLGFIAGCGGGGGGGGNNTTNNFVITGKVQDTDSKAPLSGALVNIGGQTTTTNATGDYRLEFTTPPSGTWSVGSPTGYYIYWAKIGQITTPVDPRSMTLPLITQKSTTMPTVYLTSQTNPPPWPP